MHRLRSCLRRLACFAAVLAFIGLNASAALGGYVVYLGAGPLNPGYGDATTGYNLRQYNAVSFDNPYGGLPQMGTTYQRTNGEAYAWTWSNTGWLYDDRTISYGKALCKANVGNNYQVYNYWCETGNFS